MADLIVAFLGTYLIHSSLLIGAAWLVTRPAVLERVEWFGSAQRSGLWKGALIVGVVTATANVVLPLPHWGPTWRLSSAEGPSQFVSLPTLDVAATTGAVDSAPASVADAAAIDSWSFEQLWQDFDGRRWIAILWGVGCLAALVNFARHRWALARLTSAAGRPVESGPLRTTTDRLAARLGLRRRVELYVTSQCDGPMAAGSLRSRIILPDDFLRDLDEEQCEGLLAHELAHLARRDPLWNTVAHLLGGVFFFQPLNRLARREMLVEAEFLADRLAAETLTDRLALARCLTAFSEWSIDRRPRIAWHAAAVGMGAFRSPLGRRVERLIAGGESARNDSRFVAARWPARTLWGTAVVLALAGTVFSAPRILTTSHSTSSDPEGNPPMNRIAQLGTAAVMTSVLVLPVAAAEPKIDPLPEGMKGFRGALIGKLLAKDVEKGTFVAKIVRVDHTFRPNQAPDPHSSVGKTFSLYGVAGKYLDVLLSVEPGDTVKFATFHREGDKMEFIGENMFQKVADDAPPADKEKSDSKPKEKAPATDKTSLGNVPADLAGFRGLLRGKLVSGDAEKGTLVVEVESVPKVWKLNKAADPNSAVGEQLRVEGVFGKFLDVLLTLEKGDRIEVEAFHNGGDHLRFPGEWLKKVD